MLTPSFIFQPPKKDTKGSSKQPQKTQKKKEGGSGGKAKKKVHAIKETFYLQRCERLGSQLIADV